MLTRLAHRLNVDLVGTSFLQNEFHNMRCFFNDKLMDKVQTRQNGASKFYFQIEEWLKKFVSILTASGNKHVCVPTSRLIDILPNNRSHHSDRSSDVLCHHILCKYRMVWNINTILIYLNWLKLPLLALLLFEDIKPMKFLSLISKYALKKITLLPFVWLASWVSFGFSTIGCLVLRNTV